MPHFAIAEPSPAALIAIPESRTVGLSRQRDRRPLGSRRILRRAPRSCFAVVKCWDRCLDLSGTLHRAALFPELSKLRVVVGVVYCLDNGGSSALVKRLPETRFGYV